MIDTPNNIDEKAMQLLIDFYTSNHYDPKAARNGDNMLAAIKYTLLNGSSDD